MPDVLGEIVPDVGRHSESNGKSKGSGLKMHTRQ